MVKVLVKDLNEVLSCSLCHGYFQDATTLSECLDTFCRTCIIRYCLSKKQDTITCPKCSIELGTFQHVTREGMVKDTVKQSICDIFFPPPKPEVSEETNEESLSAALLQQSKNQLSSNTLENPPVPEVQSPIKKERKEFFPPIAPSLMPTITNPIDPKKLPAKSLQNILQHKLLAGFMAHQQQQQSQAQNQPSSSSDTENKKRKSISGEESFEQEKKKSKQSHTPSARPPSVTETNPSPKTVPLSMPIEAPAVDTNEYNVKLSPESDMSLVGSPDNILPTLPRPTFKSALTVKVVKVQHFVYKRLDDTVRASLSGPEEINILCNGKSIIGTYNLMEFNNFVENETLSLTYCRFPK